MDITFGIVILIQVGTGISANGFLFLFYIHKICGSYQLSSSDFILAHLTLANTIVLLTGGVLNALEIWSLENFLDDVECKMVMYFYRVARGLSIFSTCFLSIYQAITISPGTPRWTGLKLRLSKFIFSSYLLFWIFTLLLDFGALRFVAGSRNGSRVRITLDFKYCTEVPVSTATTLRNAIVTSLRDLSFVVVMSMASGYMVIVLHRHHRRVRHLHAPGLPPGAMPEVRAAKRVIVLVVFYVLLYGRQTIMFSVLLNRKENSPWLVNSHVAFSVTFSTMSPFLMISSDRRIRALWKRDSPFLNKDP
ncbi:vomeronasal 1 receptor ornAnaV1R3219 [Ornithorhynchus anatinus]|uniref:Vomeronasal type-1 receptor n=1 Tax=Ornithorhynchus anatinus TaxID=9258 RepID=A0A6I8NYW0_ORNAN|nr:vomeronasal 1 receptor ornAnaV1R3219 [Ornithorhynchus anatinus]